MKREDVKNKIPGITEEQLNWLMQENGSDITREKFLSTLSLRRATAVTTVVVGPSSDFYPRSPCGERPLHLVVFGSDCNFYPRSPCGERQCALLYRSGSAGISIHALLAESDSQPCCTDTTSTISIHALLAESDCGPWSTRPTGTVFLSTLSLRRATGNGPDY